MWQVHGSRVAALATNSDLITVDSPALERPQPAVSFGQQVATLTTGYYPRFNLEGGCIYVCIHFPPDEPGKLQTVAIAYAIQIVHGEWQA